jgi:uncharacterized protein (TIGR03086 family)
MDSLGGERQRASRSPGCGGPEGASRPGGSHGEVSEPDKYGRARDANGAIILAGAISYALKAVSLVTPGDLSRPTPCPAWDLGLLLRHLCDSIAALDEAVGSGCLALEPPCDPPRTDDNPVELVKDRAASLLCTVFTAPGGVADIAGLPLPGALLVATAAMEITVHGWDVYVACGHDRGIPAGLAGPLIRLSPVLITDRDGLFASPIAVPPCASPGERLVAYLGRHPDGLPGFPR